MSCIPRRGTDRAAHCRDGGWRCGQGRPEPAGKPASLQDGRIPRRGAHHPEQLQPHPRILSGRPSLHAGLPGDGVADDGTGADHYYPHLFHLAVRVERSFLVFEAPESTLTPLMERVEAAFDGIRVFSLPSVGDARARRGCMRAAISTWALARPADQLELRPMPCQRRWCGRWASRAGGSGCAQARGDPGGGLEPSSAGEGNGTARLSRFACGAGVPPLQAPCQEGPGPAFHRLAVMVFIAAAFETFQHIHRRGALLVASLRGDAGGVLGAGRRAAQEQRNSARRRYAGLELAIKNAAFLARRLG
ncbi:hypothetical protein ACU4GD_40110 [Cupriavidus basilensis]